MRPISLITATALLAACAMEPAPVPETTLPFSGTGYRAEGDPCRIVGWQSGGVTNKATQLVRCPAGMESLDVFVVQTGAVETSREDGFVFYSIPLG